jgi:hypothetical protein
LKVAELDHVKQTYHFGGTGIDGKIITLDVSSSSSSSS